MSTFHWSQVDNNNGGRQLYQYEEDDLLFKFKLFIILLRITNLQAVKEKFF